MVLDGPRWSQVGLGRDARDEHAGIVLEEDLARIARVVHVAVARGVSRGVIINALPNFQ